MMNRAQVINVYNHLVTALRLSPEQVLLSAGAACVMYGVRECTSDLDVDIPADIFEDIKKMGSYPVIQTPYGELMRFTEKIDLHSRNKSHAVEVIGGVHVLGVHALLNQKFHLSSNPAREPAKIEKDKADISGLTKYLMNVRKLPAVQKANNEVIPAPVLADIEELEFKISSYNSLLLQRNRTKNMQFQTRQEKDTILLNYRDELAMRAEELRKSGNVIFDECEWAELATTINK